MGFHQIKTGLSLDHITLRLRGKKKQFVDCRLITQQWKQFIHNLYKRPSRFHGQFLLFRVTHFPDLIVMICRWNHSNKLVATIFVIACIVTSLNFEVSDAI